MEANLSNPAFAHGTVPRPLLLPWQCPEGNAAAHAGLVAELPAHEEASLAVPTLLATRLQLQLLLSERTIDLRAAAGIILNDVGATLEIFRRAGEEGAGDTGAGESASLTLRLEDCLAALGTDLWMESVCAHAVERVAVHGGQLPRLLAFWEHSRVLAYSCSVVAEHTEMVCPEEAYLVGLLHEAAQLPELLGWDKRFHGASRIVPQASALGAYWHLPPHLRAVVAGASSMPAPWRHLLQVAHSWSRGEQCPLSYTA